ncbi:MAG: OmpH family outer membrane protein [Acinetobacter sp.]|nr:OmpH family outer membrane protein [Acinetobacter sp.]
MKIKAFALMTMMAASASSFAAGYGVVDFARVADSSTYLKQQQDSISQSVRPLGTKLEQLGKELQALEKKAATEAAKMSDAERTKLEQQFKTKLEEFNKAQQDLQMRMQQVSRQAQATFESRALQVADQLRAENGVDFILDRGTVLSFDKKYDFTDKMIQKLNAIK